MDYSHLLTQSIEYKARTGRNASGDPSWSSAVSLAARVERVTEVVRDSAGNERQVDWRIVTATEIPSGALVFLPGQSSADNDNGSLFVGRKTASTPTGQIYYEAYL